MLNQTTEKDETALAFSQKVVQMLYKAPTQLGREVYAILLDRLCEASVQVNKEAIDWLLYAEDEVWSCRITALKCPAELDVIAQVQRARHSASSQEQTSSEHRSRRSTGETGH